MRYWLAVIGKVEQEVGLNLLVHVALTWTLDAREGGWLRTIEAIAQERLILIIFFFFFENTMSRL